MPITVAVIEDRKEDRIFLEAQLIRCPGIELIGQYSTAEAALDGLPSHIPDVILVDLSLPGMDGLEVVSELTRRFQGVRCLMLTGDDSRSRAQSSIRLGAYGFIVKWPTPSTLVDKIKRAADGEVSIDRRYLPQVEGPTPIALTPREREILTRLERGASQKQVADQLSLSEDTIQFHVSNARKKCGAKSTAELISYLRNFYGKQAIT